MTDRYLEPHQARTRPTTPFEDQLGDTIEAAYADGVHDLDGLVERLNADGPPCPDGPSWTADRFTTVLAELGR